MPNKETLEKYKPMVKFIYEIAGPNCEVILHDINKPDSSIIALSGNLSGRCLGGPLTDMALKILKSKRYLTEDQVTNYKSITSDGRVCRSSTFFIKDSQSKLIGILCINILVSPLLDIRNKIDELINLNELTRFIDPSNSPSTKQDETLGQNLEELMNSLIEEVLENYHTDMNELSPRQKKEIISELNEKGVFLLKGGITEVAKRIEMSEPSVYRYLAKIKK